MEPHVTSIRSNRPAFARVTGASYKSAAKKRARASRPCSLDVTASFLHHSIEKVDSAQLTNLQGPICSDRFVPLLRLALHALD